MRGVRGGGFARFGAAVVGRLYVLTEPGLWCGSILVNMPKGTKTWAPGWRDLVPRMEGQGNIWGLKRPVFLTDDQDA